MIRSHPMDVASLRHLVHDPDPSGWHEKREEDNVVREEPFRVPAGELLSTSPILCLHRMVSERNKKSFAAYVHPGPHCVQGIRTHNVRNGVSWVLHLECDHNKSLSELSSTGPDKL